MDESFALDPSTHIGHVHLRTADAARALLFYQDVLGMHAVEAPSGEVHLSAGGEREPARIVLRPEPLLRPRTGRTAGLYHFAILLPSRRALAQTYLRLRDRHWPFQGFADHAVSEALYLEDADGNGVEIYADRPRSEWKWQAGELYMTTQRLDLADLSRELGTESEPWTGLDPGAVIGHVHLHVSDLAAAERFYAGLLGFDVVVRGYPGALFLSAGGYHHHVAVNVWAGAGVRAAPADVPGLVDFQIVVPDAEVRDALRGRARARGLELEAAEGGWRVVDADGIGVVFTGP